MSGVYYNEIRFVRGGNDVGGRILAYRLINIDVMEGSKALANRSVQCVVTSPPYWCLRDYGVEGQLGLEPTIEAHVDAMVRVFREVRRVLKDDGVLWLNYGDSYANDAKWGGSTGGKHAKGLHGKGKVGRTKKTTFLPSKSLVGMPWRVALALQADGWVLRQDVIWHKPNPMPESCRDRCTTAHEYVFLLTKKPRYYFDQDAIREAYRSSGEKRDSQKLCAGWATEGKHDPVVHNKKDSTNGSRFDRGKTAAAVEQTGSAVGRGDRKDHPKGKNARSVWTITPEAFRDAHFATFPTELARRCIVAGSREGDTVLDPFAGSGTTLMVAQREGRDAIGFELNAEYCEMARRRIRGDFPLFNEEIAG